MKPRSQARKRFHERLDIFAWIVLIILAASAVGLFCIAGWLPGHGA